MAHAHDFEKTALQHGLWLQRKAFLSGDAAKLERVNDKLLAAIRPLSASESQAAPVLAEALSPEERVRAALAVQSGAYHAEGADRQRAIETANSELQLASDALRRTRQ